MHAICVLFGVDPTWNQAKILLTDIHFISNMLKYDIENEPFEVLFYANYVTSSHYALLQDEYLCTLAENRSTASIYIVCRLQTGSSWAGVCRFQITLPMGARCRAVRKRISRKQ